MNDNTQIACFGEILIDFTEDGVNDHGIVRFARHPGGAPANVAVGAARLGAATSFMGKTGDDMHGAFLKKTLEEEGVDVSGMRADPDLFTTLAFVSVTPEGEREFAFARKPGADTQMHYEELNMDRIRSARIYHFGSLSLTHEPARTATIRSAKEAKDAGVMISYDPNYRASLWPNQQAAVEQMRSMIPLADIMKISDEETALLTDFADPERAAASLIDQGVKIAAVTLGAAGALVANKEGMRVVPGFVSQVADTNGAGDAFWAAMLYQIAESGKKAEDIDLDTLTGFARFANGAAALTCRSHGAIPSLPTREAVEELLKNEE